MKIFTPGRYRLAVVGVLMGGVYWLYLLIKGHSSPEVFIGAVISLLGSYMAVHSWNDSRVRRKQLSGIEKAQIENGNELDDIREILEATADLVGRSEGFSNRNERSAQRFEQVAERLEKKLMVEVD